MSEVSALRLIRSDQADPFHAWRQPIDDFEKVLRAAGRAAGTIRLRRWQLERLGRLFSDPWEVTEDDLVEWLSNPEWSPEMRKSCRSAAQTFYRWAARRGRIAVSPAAALEPVTVPRALPRPVSEDALDQALAEATDKERLMVVLGAFAGLRAHEIARFHPKRDVQPDGLTMHIRGKGDRERVVPMHPVVLRELAAELRRRAAGEFSTGFRYYNLIELNGYLFPGNLPGKPIRPDTVSRVLSGILGTQWTAHSLRHRFASAAYAVDRDLRAVQELLGHSKPETTARYTNCRELHQVGDDLRVAC